MRVIAFITEPRVIRRIVDHLRQRERGPRPPPRRGVPDRGWTSCGEWVPVSYLDERAAEELFRHKVLVLLRRRGLLSQERLLRSQPGLRASWGRKVEGAGALVCYEGLDWRFLLARGGSHLGRQSTTECWLFEDLATRLVRRQVIRGWVPRRLGSSFL